MRQASAIFLVIAACLLPCISSPPLQAAPRPGATQIFRLDSTGDLSLIGVTVQKVHYRGRKALKLLERPYCKFGGASGGPAQGNRLHRRDD